MRARPCTVHGGRYFTLFRCPEQIARALVKWFLQALGAAGLYDLAVRYGNLEAEARTVIGFANEQGGTIFFEGSVRGRLVSPRGEDFGWNSIFQPTGAEKTFGEMSREELLRWSMRRIACEKLRDYLGRSELR